MKSYAVRFDFPERTCFAGDYKGACGFAPSLASAYLFTDEDRALSYLENGYGPETRRWGRVVAVEAS